MGHTRLGRLPLTHSWQQVIEQIDTAGEPAATARAVAQAADERLRALADDPVLVHCLWVLARVAAAARGATFADDLAALELTVPPSNSALAFVSIIADQVRRVAREHPESGQFAEIASLAVRRALTETVGMRERGLFESSVADLQAAVRPHATYRRFGALARRFFADLIARTLHAAVDRELSNRIGTGGMLATSADTFAFSQALDLYARQSARVVEDFSGGWYSARAWASHEEITPAATQRFVGHALRKLRRQLRLGLAPA